MIDFEGCQVKLTYRDGDNLRVYYGEILFLDDFIKLTFKDGSVSLVNKSEVLKIVKR